MTNPKKTSAVLNRKEHHVSKRLIDSLWEIAKKKSRNLAEPGITVSEAIESTDLSNYQAKSWFDAWAKAGFMTKTRVCKAGVTSCLYTILPEYRKSSRPPVNYKGELIENPVVAHSQVVWDIIMAFDEPFSVDDILAKALTNGYELDREYIRNHLVILARADYLFGHSQGYADKSTMRNGTTVLPYMYHKTSKVTASHVLAPVIKRGKIAINPNTDEQK